MSRTHSNFMGSMSGGFGVAQPSAASLPPIASYNDYRHKDVGATALRRVVALRREGVGWATIGQGLMMPLSQIREAYSHLPEELR